MSKATATAISSMWTSGHEKAPRWQGWVGWMTGRPDQSSRHHSRATLRMTDAMRGIGFTDASRNGERPAGMAGLSCSIVLITNSGAVLRRLDAEMVESGLLGYLQRFDLLFGLIFSGLAVNCPGLH